MNKQTNKLVIILSAVFIIITGLIIIFSQKPKTKEFPYQPENVNIGISTNQDGLQSPGSNEIQKNAGAGLNAATVDDLTGGTGDPNASQQGIDEILKDKNIDVQK